MKLHYLHPVLGPLAIETLVTERRGDDALIEITAIRTDGTRIVADCPTGPTVRVEVKGGGGPSFAEHVDRGGLSRPFRDEIPRVLMDYCVDVLLHPLGQPTRDKPKDAFQIWENHRLHDRPSVFYAPEIKVRRITVNIASIPDYLASIAKLNDGVVRFNRDGEPEKANKLGLIISDIEIKILGTLEYEKDSAEILRIYQEKETEITMEEIQLLCENLADFEKSLEKGKFKRTRAAIKSALDFLENRLGLELDNTPRGGVTRR